jgi:hypothetical protein
MINRSFHVTIRLSEKELREMKEQAEISHLTVSEYIRRRVWGKRVVPQADVAVLAELRRLGGLLKHVHLEMRGTYSELTANAIRAIEAYGKELERSHKEKNGGLDPP